MGYVVIIDIKAPKRVFQKIDVEYGSENFNKKSVDRSCYQVFDGRYIGLGHHASKWMLMILGPKSDLKDSASGGNVRTKDS